MKANPMWIKEELFENWSIGIYKLVYDGSHFKILNDPKVKNPVLRTSQKTNKHLNYVADPFLIVKDTKFYLFFENFKENKGGEIGVVVSKNYHSWKNEKIVLSEPFHLSYPNTFFWKDRYYMLPETHETGSVRLYEAVHFPDQWKFSKTLLTGKKFVDPTILFFADKVWLFVSDTTDGNLYLYYSNSLEGDWIEHPQSPVIKDNRSTARPGGNFIQIKNRLIRVAQDDLKTYGHALRAFEVSTLNTQEYSEKELPESPLLKASGRGWNKDGMHHLSLHQVAENEWIAAVDGKTYIKKYAWNELLKPLEVFLHKVNNKTLNILKTTLKKLQGKKPAKAKNKYLFLVKSNNFAGAEHFQMNYFRFMDYKKNSVLLGINNDVFGRHFKNEGLPVETFGLPAIASSDRFSDRFLKYFHFFNIHKPDRVVFNQYWLRSFGLAEVLAAFCFTRGKAYMIVHDCPFVPKSRKEQFLLVLLGYFTKTTMAVSKASGRILIDSFHFPKNKVKVLYHGVDTDKFRPSPELRNDLRRPFGISSQDHVVISTAMLWPGKKVDRLLNAFISLAEHRPDIHLLIAGKGNEYDVLLNIKESSREDIKKRIYLLGYREDIPDLLKLSDIYVLPSDSEGLGLACLEAMSCGLISIATVCGGTEEIIINGYNGFLVEKSDNGVLNGLTKALNLSTAEWKEMSENAKKSVEEQFNLQRNMEAGLKLLNLN